jgi:5'-3' exonuclease
MSTRDLIDAIEAGDASAIQQNFEEELASRIADRLDAMRQEVAKNMFNEAAKNDVIKDAGEDDDEDEDKEDEMNEMSSKEKMKRGLYNKEEAELEEATAPKQVHPDALHVQHVGGGKYKVHAVGKNFEHGVKPGEHLSDSELDDFSEMGGKIKHMK